MIYAYMWIQMNSKLITTSHKHYFLKLVVNIYFPVNVIKSRIRGEDRRGDIGHCSSLSPVLTKLLLCTCSRSAVDNVLCACITGKYTVLCEQI